MRSRVAQYVPSVPSGFDHRREDSQPQCSGYGAHMPFESLDIWKIHMENPVKKHFFHLPYIPKFVENPMETFKPTRISMIFAPRCSTCGSCRLRTKTGSSLDMRGFPWMSLPHRSLHHRVSVPWLALRNFGHQRGNLWFQALHFSGCSNHFKAVLECEHQTTQTACCFDTQSGSATPRRHDVGFFSRHVIPLRTSKITFAPASFKAVANCSDDHTGTASRAVFGFDLVTVTAISFAHIRFLRRLLVSEFVAGTTGIGQPSQYCSSIGTKDTTNQFKIHLSASVDYDAMDKWLMY